MANLGRESSTGEQGKYVFNLYVTGTTTKSTQAISEVKRVLEARLNGMYTLKVIDIYQQPLLTSHARITVVPTLVCDHPLPFRKIVGDLCEESILAKLDLPQDKVWTQAR